MELITLEQAKAVGLHRFFTGVPCKHGHVAERYVSGRHTCVVCKAESERRWYDRHQAEVLEYRAKLRAKPQHKEKQSAKAREWREENKDYVKEKQKEWYDANPGYHKEIRNRLDKRPGRMLTEAKCRAKKFGLEFDITVDDIIIPTVCPVLGIPILFSGPRNNVPSLDRVDNTKGYVKGNVCVISMRANVLKMNGTIREFDAIISYMKQYIREKPL